MKAKWLIETSRFNDSTHKLVKEARKQGMLVKKFPYVPFDTSRKFLNLFDERDCVIFYGSLNFARRIQREAPWVPGVYCNKPLFECLYYYPRFGSLLLNEDYIFLSYGDLKRKKDFLYDTFSTENIFIRPSSGFKEFTGKPVYIEDFEKQIERFGVYDINPESLVVVSEAKNIKREWRLIVSDRVITGSRYQIGKTLTSDDNVVPPQEVIDFGNKVVQEVDYKPDPIWVLDICETNNGLHVLEVGSFSCAGYYNSDISAIVTEASKIAEEEYNDIYESNLS